MIFIVFPKICHVQGGVEVVFLFTIDEKEHSCSFVWT